MRTDRRSPIPPCRLRLEASSNWMQWGQVLGPAADMLATSGLVIVLVLFMLIYQEDLRGRLILLVGHGRLVATTRGRWTRAALRVGRYLLMQTLVNAAVGATLSAGLWLIGVPYAVMWGVLAAVFRFIPYLGIWGVAALIMVVSIAVFPGWTQPLWVMALIAAVELLVANAIEPLLFGHSIGVIPIALVIAAVIWTWLWGPVGLLLSTPLTTCLVVLGKHVPALDFFDVLLADGGVLSPDLNFYQRLLAKDQDEEVEIVENYLRDHPSETLYDEMLVPAMARAKRDRAMDRLSSADQQIMFHAIEDILDETRSVAEPPPATNGKSPESAEHEEPARLVLLGCPARDEADELALQMFAQLLDSSKCPVTVELLSAKSLVAEVVSQVAQHKPVVVCIAAIPPGGLAQVRYLCKRLRAIAPEQKIIVGRWGAPLEHAERIRNRLRDIRINHVATTLIESRNQVLSWIPVPSAPAPAPPTEAAVAVSPSA